MKYLLFGHPRGGTSTAMRGLYFAGMNVWRDVRRDQKAHRDADREGFTKHPNPYGFWEVPYGVGREHDWPNNLPDGWAAKVFAPTIRQLRDRGTGEWMVAYLTRDPDEIAASYRRMMGRPTMRWRTADQYHARVDQDIARLEAIGCVVSVTRLDYNAMCADPPASTIAEYQRLADAGWPLDPRAVAELIDPALRRNVREADLATV
ncbi:MAG TPA: hypothetical protein VMW08_00160 [Acidimicrobiales bacterium]|nr:hypothetical protein [Acidimicrobiales bacterium]